jgi:hypothetical protein
MGQFLDGVCRENERYKEPQLHAILAFLEERHPRPDFLEAVLAQCCRTSSYRFTQFKGLYDRHEAETPVPATGRQGELFHTSATVHMPDGIDVQVRDQTVYQDFFRHSLPKEAR